MRFAIPHRLFLQKFFAVLFAASLLAGPASQLTAGSSDEKSIAPPTHLFGQPALLVGVAWYPEQWPESRWEEDLRLMEAANIKVVRIAEFAWSRLEPSEGHYDFDWLDRAIMAAAKHH